MKRTKKDVTIMKENGRGDPCLFFEEIFEEETE